MLIIGEAERIEEGGVYGNLIFCKPKIALKQILLRKIASRGLVGSTT